MTPLSLIDEFLQQAAADERLTSLHISLYMVIIHRWYASGGQNPFHATRLQLMQYSKIGSKSSYHRCIRDLQNKGYFLFQSSNHPIEGNCIKLTCPKSSTTSYEGSTESGTTSFGGSTKNGTTSLEEQHKTPQQNPPMENRLRNCNTEYNPIDKIPKFATNPSPKETSESKKNKKKSYMYDIYNNINTNNRENIEENLEGKELVSKSGQPPDLTQITAFFQSKNQPAIEAEKFFNYYQANGWKVGKNPMKNWQAAARNWILNISQFSNASPTLFSFPGNLNATTQKDYSEPL